MPRAHVDPDRLRRELESLLGARRVSMRDGDLDTYARDMWPRLLLARRDGQLPEHRPHAVVWPETQRELVALVKLARSLAIPVIPYGGGSGVCGGVVPLRGGITIDLKRMQAIRSVSRDEMVVDVEAGLSGERFERELRRRGYTFGNFPSSIYCSTVGGWLATRAAGQLSTKYGKVEDRVAGLTVITGRGELIETDGPSRAVRGPNWTQLLVGSEGTLGIIAAARLRLSTAPQLEIFRGFEFDDVAAGTEAIRRVLQRGLRPAVVRLYDELDTFINSLGKKAATGDHAGAPITTGYGAPHDLSAAPVPMPGEGALPVLPRPEPPADDGVVSRLLAIARGRRRGLHKEAVGLALDHAKLVNRIAGTVARRGCRMVIGLEGARIRTEVEAALTFAELAHAGGRDTGEEAGWAWLAHRYAVSYRMSPTFRDGAFVDTMEVASTWERLMDLYHSVRDAISQHAVVMAHFSHAYAEGCSIYFTFAAHADDLAGSRRLYDTIWRDGLEAVTRVGGTISHHHGVGLLKGPYMAGEHREGMAVLHGLKQSLDPDNLMNPGKLGMAAAPTGVPRKEAS
ncbi:MAG: FAD-binding oxidoreductase [Kofleriaceae bacterium]|nr:FAD-binding oxidoreductase [Kofleriaceae bacterium]MCB9571589.1 FAD-binding oxidoreductase [Kofleriaceae bacterium]